MKASVLPNLRGKISNNNRLKIELTKAINQAIVYAKRSAVGYAAVSDDVSDLLYAALTQLRSWTRADSITVLPVSNTKAVAQTQQISLTATYPDGVTEAVSASDPRVTYATSNAARATVSATGLVTAVATGSAATITVTFQGRTDTYLITVS